MRFALDLVNLSPSIVVQLGVLNIVWIGIDVLNTIMLLTHSLVHKFVQTLSHGCVGPT